jgi:Fis1 C-terminal tetratricopeptide repeat
LSKTEPFGVYDLNETSSCRYVWNLVHSGWRTDNERGRDLAFLLMESQDLEEPLKRDLVYLIAVADYKLGNLIHARKQLAALLKVSIPDLRFLSLLQKFENRDCLLSFCVKYWA